MSVRVLVAYATKHGATEEIAQKIGEVLSQAGLSPDVLPAGSAGDLTPYAAVVLGSAVYVGAWRKEAVAFLKDNESALAQLPVWIFSSGPTGEGDAAELENDWLLPTALRDTVERIGPRDIVLFHGEVDIEELSLGERLMVKMVKAPAGDYRDWDAIASWAESIAQVLKASA